MRRTFPARRLLLIAALAGAAFLLSGCEVFDSPQNTFSPRGDVAESQKDDFFLVMWPALVIMIGVLSACIAIPIMFRRKKDDPGLPKQVHGNTFLELGWTIIPAILMLIVGIFVVDGIIELGRKPADDAFKVQVIGRRFSWEFQYTDLVDQNGQPLLNEYIEGVVPVAVLRLPVDREIGLTIDSEDVNHSFWVPRLAGKVDAIDGHTNEMWIKATEPGTYEGQCAEFCGTEHAYMRMRVIVHTQEEFDAWVEEQGATYRDPNADEDAELATSGD
jgi:cytochrome c oxidase subunit 2